MKLKIFWLSFLLLSGCGGGGDISYNTPIRVFVSGLDAGKELTLQLNDDEILAVSANGSSTFTKPVPVGSSYKVAVHEQPPGFQWCDVVNEAGITDETTPDINVNCGAALGQVTTYAGKYKKSLLSPDDVLLKDATFQRPYYPVYDKEGNLYFIELNARVIRKISKDGKLTTFAGTPNAPARSVEGGVNTGSFKRPNIMVLGPDGLLYVADDKIVVTVDPDGNIKRYAGDYNSSQSPNPYDPSGKTFTRYLDGPKDRAFFYQLVGLAFDSQGNLFLSDNINYVIRRIDKLSGDVTTVAGIAGLRERVNPKNGAATSATFGDIFALTIDAKDNIYVLDTYNGIRKITPEGVVSTYYKKDALVIDTRSIIIDAYGDLYVGGILSGPHISRISPSGVATLVAGGMYQQLGANDGIGSAARFEDTVGLAIAPDGSIIVTDSLGGTLRKVVPVAPNRP